MDKYIYSAFCNELEKIAMFEALRKGWKGYISTLPKPPVQSLRQVQTAAIPPKTVRLSLANAVNKAKATQGSPFIHGAMDIGNTTMQGRYLRAA